MKTSDIVTSDLSNDVEYIDNPILDTVLLFRKGTGNMIALNQYEADRLLNQLLARKERINNERQDQDR